MGKVGGEERFPLPSLIENIISNPHNRLAGTNLMWNITIEMLAANDQHRPKKIRHHVQEAPKEK